MNLSSAQANVPSIKPIIKNVVFPLKLYSFLKFFINVTITLVMILAKIPESHMPLLFLNPSAITSLALC